MLDLPTRRSHRPLLHDISDSFTWKLRQGVVSTSSIYAKHHTIHDPLRRLKSCCDVIGDRLLDIEGTGNLIYILIKGQNGAYSIRIFDVDIERFIDDEVSNLLNTVPQETESSLPLYFHGTSEQGLLYWRGLLLVFK